MTVETGETVTLGQEVTVRATSGTVGSTPRTYSNRPSGATETLKAATAPHCGMSVELPSAPVDAVIRRNAEGLRVSAEAVEELSRRIQERGDPRRGGGRRGDG